jgi:hypothetical protein
LNAFLMVTPATFPALAGFCLNRLKIKSAYQ